MRVFGIIYFIAICATGLFQTVLIAEGIEYCTGLGDFTTNTLALITTYIPIVGSGLAVYGAVNVLGSGLIDHIQKMTMAAMAIADMKVWAQRS
jgi:hypothetical protein